MTAAPLDTLDAATIELIRLSAVISAGDDAQVRAAFADIGDRVPPLWIDELVLQSHLFAGFPRALNAAREWRRVGPPAQDAEGDANAARADHWRTRGEATCAAVYGHMYQKLRDSVHLLHPALDSAMIEEGYGRILGRPGLDLPRRELCIVAACAATRQDRQLESHLHGALNVGVTRKVLAGAIDALRIQLGDERTEIVRAVLARVVVR